MPTAHVLRPLTAKRRALFLDALALHGNVTYAARTAGFTRQAAHWHRDHDEEFAAAWDAALEEAADELEREAWRRAREGYTEPLVSMGKIVREPDGTPMTVRKYSDSLMQTLLKAARPQKYRENVKVSGSIEHSLVPSGQVKALADELLDAVKHLPDARAALSARLLSGEA